MECQDITTVKYGWFLDTRCTTSYVAVATCARALPLHITAESISRETDKFLTFLHPQGPQILPYRGFLSRLLELQELQLISSEVLQSQYTPPLGRRTCPASSLHLLVTCPTSPSRPWGSSSPLASRKAGHLVRTGAGPRTI